MTEGPGAKAPPDTLSDEELDPRLRDPRVLAWMGENLTRLRRLEQRGLYWPLGIGVVGLAAHVGGGSFNYRARFLPKWHDLCERAIGRQLEAGPDLERLQILRDAVVGYRGDPERLDRRSTSPPPEEPRAVGAEEARWAVELAPRVGAEFHRAAGRDAPG